MDGVDRGDLESRFTQGLKQPLPDRPLLVRVVESKDQETIVRKARVNSGKCRSQAVKKILAALSASRVLNDLVNLWGVLRREVGICVLQRQPKPNVVEVGKLGIIHV